jgi:hydrogenase maturation factor
MGVIASGALLIVTAPEDATQVLAAIRQAGVEASVIGTMRPREEGRKIRVGGEVRDLPAFERDEIAKLFS